MDRSYDSEDEQTHGRRRLRHTLSTELQPRTSVYSRGDIREQVSGVNQMNEMTPNSPFISPSPRSTALLIVSCTASSNVHVASASLAASHVAANHRRRAASLAVVWVVVCPPMRIWPPMRPSRSIHGRQRGNQLYIYPWLILPLSFSYQNNYTDTNELDSSYFRRQPASILSTGSSKSTETDPSRYNWIAQQQGQAQTQANNNTTSGYATDTRYESVLSTH